MGASLFILDGLFPGIRLIFMDRNLYVDDYRKRVRIKVEFHSVTIEKNQSVYDCASYFVCDSIPAEIVTEYCCLIPFGSFGIDLCEKVEVERVFDVGMYSLASLRNKN